ncbi:hypothetical protein B0H13DRAFT_1880501 [Mycena leptocephala]|nr:hypothetical protein B0H13DRAFT_1880501 [Mycena leptocephala]
MIPSHTPPSHEAATVQIPHHPPHSECAACGAHAETHHRGITGGGAVRDGTVVESNGRASQWGVIWVLPRKRSARREFAPAVHLRLLGGHNIWTCPFSIVAQQEGRPAWDTYRSGLRVSTSPGRPVTPFAHGVELKEHGCARELHGLPPRRLHACRVSTAREELELGATVHGGGMQRGARRFKDGVAAADVAQGEFAPAAGLQLRRMRRAPSQQSRAAGPNFEAICVGPLRPGSQKGEGDVAKNTAVGISGSYRGDGSGRSTRFKHLEQCRDTIEVVWNVIEGRRAPELAEEGEYWRPGHPSRSQVTGHNPIVT